MKDSKKIITIIGLVVFIIFLILVVNRSYAINESGYTHQYIDEMIIEDEDKLYIRVPRLKNINNSLENKINKKIQYMYIESLSNYNISKSLDENSQLFIDFSIKTQTSDILSIELDKTYYDAFNNKLINERFYYNIDLENKKLIRLEDLFESEDSYIDIINEQILKYIKKDDSKNYYEDERQFISIGKDQEFYLDRNKNIYIVFNPGEIASLSSNYINIPVEDRPIKPIYFESELYNYKFKILPSWKDYIDIFNNGNTVEFIYKPVDSKLKEYKILNITVENEDIYKHKRENIILEKNSSYVYYANIIEKNPYDKEKEQLDYMNLDRILDSLTNIEDLFILEEEKVESDEDKEAEEENTSIKYDVKELDYIILNGHRYNLANPIKLEGGKAMLPIAELARQMGYEVAWDNLNWIVFISKNDQTSKIYTTTNRYTYLDSEIKLDQPAILEKGVTYVPINFLNIIKAGSIYSDSNYVLNIDY